MALPPIPVPMVTLNWGGALNDYLTALASEMAEPAGMIKQYAGSSAPQGWTLCDGRTVGRQGTYALLFAAIGTRYGAGDGTSTFTLPNFKGRLLVGIDTSQPEFDPAQNIPYGIPENTPGVGMYGGAKTHTLIGSEIPSHAHDMTHAHTWSATHEYGLLEYYTTSGAQTGTPQKDAVGLPLYTGIGPTSYSGSLNHIQASTGWKGGTLAHNNLMPYTLVNYIISLGN